MRARLGAVLLTWLLLSAPAAAAEKTYPEAVTSGYPAALTDAVVQPDGKVVAVGYAYQGANFQNADMIVLRFDPATLALDPTFNGTGVRRIAFDRKVNGDDLANAVALGPGGGIFVIGSAAGPSGTDIAVQKLTATGQDDGGFGPSGQRTFAFGSFASGLAGAVDANGVATIAGSAGTFPGAVAVVRVDASGNPVTAFDADGRATVSAGTAGRTRSSAWSRLAATSSGLAPPTSGRPSRISCCSASGRPASSGGRLWTSPPATTARSRRCWSAARRPCSRSATARS